MSKELHLGTRAIGPNHPPFVIAEMSGNHNQSLDRALAIVDAAAEAGAHALKLQTYTPDTMTLDSEDAWFQVSDPGSLWKGRSLYDLYREAHTPWEWHEPIFRRARELGLICFSTPFDETAVEFLESLEVPCFKIASFENTDLPLVRKAASTGKPLIVSTGMASLSELEDLVGAARAAGCRELILLKCTSTYPATPLHSNLATIPHLRDAFQCEVGLSDHTLGVGVAVASVALGVRVIEKHFTLDRRDGGVDAAFSMEPSELKSLVAETERAWQAMGSIHYGPLEAERGSMVFRRSIFIVQDLPSGTILGPEHLRIVRPGFGLPPKTWDRVLGRRLKVPVKRGTPLRWDLLA